MAQVLVRNLRDDVREARRGSHEGELREVIERPAAYTPEEAGGARRGAPARPHRAPLDRKFTARLAGTRFENDSVLRADRAKA